MLNLTDENFELEISKSDKPILVDFWAEWCHPCLVLGQILENIANDYQGKMIIAKANLDFAPLAAQKYKIDSIPAVILFRKGKPVSGFVGTRPEPIIKELLDKMLEDKGPEESTEDKEINASSSFITNAQAVEINELIEFYAQYARKNGFKLNPDRKTAERIVGGLLVSEKKYKAKYCPCRRITGDLEEDKKNICPCFYHRQEIEKDGHCLCNLFVKQNDIVK